MSTNVSTIETNRTVVDDFNAAIFGRHEPEAVSEFLSPDFVQYESGEETVRGIDEAREYFEGMLGAFPDVEMDVVETTVDDERVVQFFEMSATHEGEMRIDEDRVIEPTGERMNWYGFVSLRIEDGKILKANLMTDDMALYSQLGLIPVTDGLDA